MRAGEHAEPGDRPGGPREARDAQAARAPIRQPSPEMGRDDASQLRRGQEDAYLDGGQADAIQIEAEERRKRAQVGEVEKVEAGEAPV